MLYHLKTNMSRYFDYPTGAKLGIFNGTQGLGGVASQFFLWWLVEKIGRKYTIIIGSVIIIIGVFLQTFANGLVMFAVARAIIGLGLSFEYTAAPMLVAELAHPTHRAQLSTFLNTLYNFGATIAAWICLGTLTIQNDWSWRSVSLIQIFPSLISVALTWWVPESPSKLFSSLGYCHCIFATLSLMLPTQDGLFPKVATKKHSISCVPTIAAAMRATNLQLSSFGRYSELFPLRKSTAVAVGSILSARRAIGTGPGSVSPVPLLHRLLVPLSRAVGIPSDLFENTANRDSRLPRCSAAWRGYHKSSHAVYHQRLLDHVEYGFRFLGRVCH